MDGKQPQVSRPTEVIETARDAGFRCETQWIDEQWPFAENLLIAE